MSVKLFFDIPMQFPIKKEIVVGSYKLYDVRFKDGDRQDYISNSNISVLTLGDLCNVYCSAPSEYRRVPFGWWLAHMGIDKGRLDIYKNKLSNSDLVDLYKKHHLDPYLLTVLALINFPELDFKVEYKEEEGEWWVTWQYKFTMVYFSRMINSSNFDMWNSTVQLVFKKLGLPDPCIRAVDPKIRETESRILAKEMDLDGNEMLY